MKQKIALTAYEFYDERKVMFLYENRDNLLPKIFKSVNPDDVQGSITNTVKFFEKVIENDGKIKVDYFYADKANYGRKFAKVGIQNTIGLIRNFLLCDNKNIVDLDLKNAHPSIVLYLCYKYHITDTPNLIRYVKNRDDVIENEFSEENYSYGRNYVKRLMLIATNSDELTSKNKFLVDYFNEIRKITKILIEHKDFKKLYKDVEKDKNKNLQGSFLNRILCKCEELIINDLIKFVKPELFANMFDGALFKTTDEHTINLDEVNTFIQSKYDFEFFEFTLKPIINELDIVIPHNYVYDKIKYEKQRVDYDSVKKYHFEEIYKPIKILKPPSYILTIDEEEVIFEKKALIEAMEHIKFYEWNRALEELVVKTLITEWLKREDNLSLRTCIVNQPNCDNPRVYNKWKNWDIENYSYDEVDNSAIEYMVNHIKILCNNDEKICEQMLDWLAHLFQYPQYKSYVPIFSGKQGSGKNMLLEWISKIMGHKKYFETTKPERDVWGNFNPIMLDCYLVHLCEFSRKNSYAYEAEIKNIVTDSTITINDKNKSPFVIDSYHRFIGSTNSNDPIPLEASNRRYMIIMTSSEKIGDKEYFQQGFDYLNDTRAMYSMYKFLKERNVPKRLDFHSLELSDYQRHLMTFTQSITLLWLKTFVQENAYNSHNDKFEMKARELYYNFKDFLSQNGYDKYDVKQSKFSKDLYAEIIKEGFKGVCKSDTRCKDGLKFIFDMKLLNKELNIE
jgi:hypothetical protein